jgi:hypothetical protein
MRSVAKRNKSASRALIYPEGAKAFGGTQHMLFDLSVPWWELVLSGVAVFAATLGVLRLQ